MDECLTRYLTHSKDHTTHHHSLINRTISGLQSESNQASAQSIGNYSRTPELRVSHKLAERKRRSEMKDLFEELNKAVPANGGSKASKWEVLTKGTDLKTAGIDLLKPNLNLAQPSTTSTTVSNPSNGYNMTSADSNAMQITHVMPAKRMKCSSARSKSCNPGSSRSSLTSHTSTASIRAASTTKSSSVHLKPMVQPSPCPPFTHPVPVVDTRTAMGTLPAARHLQRCRGWSMDIMGDRYLLVQSSELVGLRHPPKVHARNCGTPYRCFAFYTINGGSQTSGIGWRLTTGESFTFNSSYA